MKKRTKESSGNAESKIHWQGQGDQAMKDYNYTKKNLFVFYNKKRMKIVHLIVHFSFIMLIKLPFLCLEYDQKKEKMLGYGMKILVHVCST